MIVIGSECYENVCYKHGTANFSFSLRLRQGGLPRRGDSSKLEWLQHQANKAEVCSRHSPCKGLAASEPRKGQRRKLLRLAGRGMARKDPDQSSSKLLASAKPRFRSGPATLCELRQVDPASIFSPVRSCIIDKACGAAPTSPQEA